MFGWVSRLGEIVKDWWDRLTGRGREEEEEDEDEEEEDEDEEEEDEDDEDEDEDDEDEDEEEESEGEGEGDDDYIALIEMLREIEDDIDQHAVDLTTVELARTDELLEQLYKLLSEYETLDADDRNALIDLSLEVLEDLERIIYVANVRHENDDACPQRRGPFTTRDEAKAYAEEIPLPTWVYQDGLGWWWVCIEESTPVSVES